MQYCVHCITSRAVIKYPSHWKQIYMENPQPSITYELFVHGWCWKELSKTRLSIERRPQLLRLVFTIFQPRSGTYKRLTTKMGRNTWNYGVEINGQWPFSFQRCWKAYNKRPAWIITWQLSNVHGQTVLSRSCVKRNFKRRNNFDRNDFSLWNDDHPYWNVSQPSLTRPFWKG